MGLFDKLTGRGEDPWDRTPDAAPRPADSTEEKPENAASLTERLAEKLHPAKKPEAELPAMACPWCGGEMQCGHLTGARGIYWLPGRPNWKSALIGVGSDALRVDDQGGLLSYKTSWLCPVCEKLVVQQVSQASQEECGSDCPQLTVEGEERTTEDLRDDL